jgi:hypothetical protein
MVGEVSHLAFETSLLSFCPRITADEHRLIAATSWAHRIVTIGLSLRRVTVDRHLKIISIDHRRAWFWHRRVTFQFREIEAVTYGYEDVSPASSMNLTYDSVDRFIVGLKPFGKEEVPLFHFVGDGTFTNDGPMPDWWYWDEYLTDWSGNQQRESRLFVQLLSKMIGVTVTPSSLTPITF